MDEDRNAKKENKARGFFSRFIEKIDEKMAKKAKSEPCSCKSSDKEKNSCCS